MTDPHRPITARGERSYGGYRPLADGTVRADEPEDSRHPDPPPRLTEIDDHLRHRFQDASRLLCCLDFDGTLAPIVADPDDAVLPEPTREALQQLAGDTDIHVAIVSGRELSDLRARVAAPVTLVGNHGLELERAGKRAIHPVAKKQSTVVATCCGLLETVLDPLWDCRVEFKGLTGTVHLRSVSAGASRHVRSTVQQLVENVAGESVSLSTGKDVLELRPAMDWGKGDAVELLLSEEPARTVPIYLGDDTTDEHAFAAVEPRGVGILVGKRRPSVASRRVDSPATVSSLLEWFAEEGTGQLETADRSGSDIYPLPEG